MSDKTVRLRRLALFGAIYFVEGAVLTYFSTFNVIYLRTFGISFTRIGIVGGITLSTGASRSKRDWVVSNLSHCARGADYLFLCSRVAG